MVTIDPEMLKALAAYSGPVVRYQPGVARGVEMPKRDDRVQQWLDAHRRDAAPYRHARLSAMKLAGDPNSPAHFKDDATADELRAEINRRLTVLQKAGIIELQPLQAPEVQ
jgi:hypothetical protein